MVWCLSSGCDWALFEVFVKGTAVKSIEEIKNGDLVEIVATRESDIDQAVAVSESRPLSYFALESNEGYDSGDSDLGSDDSCCDSVK